MIHRTDNLIIYKTGEVDITMRKVEGGYMIEARGDLDHHIFEGICSVIKLYKPDFPHIVNVEGGGV